MTRNKKISNGTPTNDTQKCINYLDRCYSFRYNLVKKTTEFCPKGKNVYRDLEDEDFRSIRIELSKDSSVNFKWSRELLKDIVYSNTTWPLYDPFCDWIDHLPKWDGKDHIARLAHTVKTTDDKYFCWTLRKWLVGFVACLYVEKEVNQTCLFLCGGQGVGKSTWIKNLLPKEIEDYYASGSLNFGDKDSQIQLSELAIFNLDEGNSLKPKDIDNLKELITMSKTKKRRAYSHKPSVFIRRCSFCGTANKLKILHDMSGNRRFLCHNVLSINYKHNVDMSQVYAQAMHIYRTGKFHGRMFHYWFDNKEQQIVEAYNKNFRNESVEEMLINEMYERCDKNANGCQKLTASEICNQLAQKNPSIRLSPQAVGSTLSQMRFKENYVHGGIHKWLVKEKNSQHVP